jgi:hypothetical protein
MGIKILVLRTGEQVISKISEVSYEEKFKGYLFKDPHSVTVNRDSSFLVEENDQDKVEMVLSPWIPLSSDNEVFVVPDYVVAIVEPVESVKNIYIEKVGVD